jgi:hypothetical protein
MRKSSLLLLIFLLPLIGAAQDQHSPAFRFHAWKDEQPQSATDSILRLWLAPQTVNDDQPVARTLYFWTSFPDLDSSLKQDQLLRSTYTRDVLAGKYRDELMYHSRDNEPVVNHLMSGERQRVREAWPCYWQNMHNDTGYERRGQLVQVVLMDSSLIVSFFPDKKKSERWQVHDLRGNLITMESALARKRHIAAVFISGDDKIIFRSPRRAVFREHYRAFFLCNEDMIKSWHHAVPGLQAKVVQDFDYLVLLHAWFEKPEHCAAHGPKGKTCYAAWTKLSTQMTVTGLFFATGRRAGYLEPPADQVETKKIIGQLRERWQTQMMPCERFPGRK